jgi:tetratricopeptide (TPR) repeat protein
MAPELPSNKIGKSVGERLRAARLSQHYTQSQLAAPDFSVSYISAIERGQIHPSLRALEILAGRLGVTSTQLLPNKAQGEQQIESALLAQEQTENDFDSTLLNIHIEVVRGGITQAVEKLEWLATQNCTPHQRLYQQYLLGLAFYKKGRYQESEYILSEAVQEAKEQDQTYLHSRLLYQLAMTYTAMNNYTQALQMYRHSLEILAESGAQDTFFEVQVEVQIGQTYTQQGQLEQAIATFHQALVHNEAVRQPEDGMAEYTRLSQYYASIGEYDIADLYAYKGLYFPLHERLRELRSDIYYHLGRAMIKIEPEQTHRYLKEELKKETIGIDQLVQATLLTRDAEWHLEQEELSEAKNEAQRAYMLLPRKEDTIPDSLIAADTLIILARVEYLGQQYEDGERHFTSGLDMLEHMNSHEELADESFRYAELLESIGQEHKAFIHLRRAFQSRQAVGK